MDNLIIEERNNTLVVDSRLVAKELGIKHSDWFRNIVIKYKKEIERDFGVISFENGKPLKGSQGGRPEQFAYFTEEQATVLMTYSRNTEKVRRCKRQLVKAFIQAKKLLSISVTTSIQNIPALPSAEEQLRTLELGMNLFDRLGGWDERTNVLLKDRVRNILLEDRLQPSPKVIAEEPKRLEYPVSDRAIGLGYQPNNSQLLRIGKHARKLYEEKHGCQPPKKEQFVGGTTRMVNAYGYEDLDLLDEAIALVMKSPSKKKLEKR